MNAPRLELTLHRLAGSIAGGLALLLVLAWGVGRAGAANAVFATQKLVAAEAAPFDGLGQAVALSGDTAVVGTASALGGQGAATVFVRSGGVWAQQARLTASDGVPFDAFGASVAVGGDTIVLGAPGQGVHTGAAYVFQRTGTQWSQTARLAPSDGVLNDEFGGAVAVAQGLAVVGARHHDSPNDPDSGAAYVFALDSGAWTQQAVLTAANGAANDGFGTAVSAHAGVVLVGAPNAGATHAGAAYLFAFNGLSWSQSAMLTADDGAAGDGFGEAVALDTALALVGAAGDDNSGGRDAGAGYVFAFNILGWSQQAKLTATTAWPGAHLGRAVALDAGTAVLGARDDTAGANSGVALMFSFNGLNWTQSAWLQPDDVATDDAFGVAVAVGGDTVLAGAPGADGAAGLNMGAAYAFVPATLTDPGLVVTTAADTLAADGVTSLREAMLYANSHSGPDTITFAIPGAGPHVIAPASALPTLSEAVTIDGYSQPGAVPNTQSSGDDAALQIQLDGSAAGSGVIGLRLSGGQSTVRGLAITGFGGAGIVLQGTGGDVIAGNFIGLAPAGSAAGNGGAGVGVQNSAGHRIGGTEAADRNVIGSNGGDGVALQGDAAMGNLVQGNLIGTDATGTAARSNGGAGVGLHAANGNTIGGAVTGAGNVVSGNAGPGVLLELSCAGDNVVQGNLIGTNADGTTPLGNGGAGVLLTRRTLGNTIGGTASGARNIISGNTGPGVVVREGATINAIQGNWIGVDGTGAVALGNSGAGVSLEAPANTVGGGDAAHGNVIGGNGAAGVAVSARATSSVIQNNRIGTDAGGTLPLGNNGAGVELNSGGNTVGGAAAATDPSAMGNRIAYNRGAGVLVAAGTGNVLRGNAIFGNDELGLDLNGDNVTTNDTGDADTGPNNRQNFPMLTSATATNGNTVLSGSLNGKPRTSLRLDFYRNSSATGPDSTGYGEGEIYAGSLNVTTNSSGNATFSFTAPGAFAGQTFAATATNPGTGDTSEFGPIILATRTLSINDITLSEGNAGASDATFTVTLSDACDQVVTADYATADGTATAGLDYTAVTAGTVTFQPGETSRTLTVPVLGDTLDEANETFFVNLSNLHNATLGHSQGIGTISDDDPLPALSINDATVGEGNSGTVDAVFTVNLTAPSAKTVTVKYATINSNAVAPGDYTAVPVTIMTFAPGETSKTVTVAVQGDLLDEANETFSVRLSAPVNAIISRGTGIGTIIDDDPAPSLSIDDVVLPEGDSGTTDAVFTVSLSVPSGRTVKVNYATASLKATTPGDYVRLPATTLTFAPGETAKTIAVPVQGDTVDEPDETFKVNLSSAVNATLADAQGIGTILDDDGPPALSVNDVVVSEGTGSGTANATFRVRLTGASTQTVTVAYATADGTATAPADYTAKSGTLSFAPGETGKNVTVVVKSDGLTEGDETFLLNLSNPANATLDDGQGITTIHDPPTLTISDATALEGDAGTTTPLACTVALSAPSSQTVTVNWATLNGNAGAPADYAAASGTLSFAPGETSKTVTLTINGDATDEPNETFAVRLSGATNAPLARSQNVVTITDDDAPPAMTISDAVVNEGNAGTTVAMTFTVALAAPSGRTVKINYATLNGTATAPADYTAVPLTTLTFAPGETFKNVTVTVLGDDVPESNETFLVKLSGAANAIVTRNIGTGTINDDDASG